MARVKKATDYQITRGRKKKRKKERKKERKTEGKRDRNVAVRLL